MVDTVVLVLQSNQFVIAPSAYTRFSPSVRNFFKPPYADFGNRKVLDAYCNPTNADKFIGYFPQLTLFKAVRKGGIQVFLHIQFSVPKLVHGNNFDEVEDSDFDYICVLLQRRLQHYGVTVNNRNTLANAEVKTIHYSHNIALTDHTTASSLIKEISKVNISKQKDINVSNYWNSGEAVKFHTNTWELIFYDKIKDLYKAKVSDKRCIEDDYYSQLSLFDKHPPKRPFEVMRIEARYNDKTKIKSSLKKAGVEPVPELTFRSLYSEKLARAMLQHEFEAIKAAYPSILLSQSNSLEDLYAELTIHNPEATLKSKLEAIAYRAILNETGSRDIRTLGNDKPEDWYKFQSRINKLKVAQTENDSLTLLEKALDDCYALKLRHYLENVKG